MTIRNETTYNSENSDSLVKAVVIGFGFGFVKCRLNSSDGGKYKQCNNYLLICEVNDYADDVV